MVHPGMALPLNPIRVASVPLDGHAGAPVIPAARTVIARIKTPNPAWLLRIWIDCINNRDRPVSLPGRSPEQANLRLFPSDTSFRAVSQKTGSNFFSNVDWFRPTKGRG